MNFRATRIKADDFFFESEDISSAISEWKEKIPLGPTSLFQGNEEIATRGSSKVTLQLEGNYVRFRLNASSDSSSLIYQRYKEATAGTRYVRDLKGKLAPLDKVPDILVRLREAGFDTVVSTELVRVLQGREATRWLDLTSAKDRIEKIDAEILRVSRERGEGEKRMFPYQKTGAQWLTLRQGALLADEQGTGKTLQTIAAIPANVPVVVVAPAVAKGVWMGEVAQWRPHLRVSILKGRESFRWPQPGEMVVTNYDILPEIHDRKGLKGRKCEGYLPPDPCPGCKKKLSFDSARKVATALPDGHLDTCTGFLEPRICPGCHPILDKALPNTVVVFDEAHYLKNFKASRTQSGRAVAKSAREKEGRSWLLTGTPLENEPKDLWSVLQAGGLAEEAFGDWPTFVKLFRGKTTPYGYTWGLPDDAIKERLRRVSLRRMRQEVLPQLPTKMWQVREVDIDEKALRECDRFIKDQGGIDRIMELLEKDKISFELMSSVRAALASAKIPAMLAIIKEQEMVNNPLVVFSAHRAPIDTLAKRPGWAVITGDVAAHKKTEIEKAFQAGKLKGVGLTIRAGGIAITLTKGHRCLFVDQDFKSTANAQAEDRVCRIGQDRGVIIEILKANHPLDRRITEILVRKSKLIAASIDAASVGEEEFSNVEIEDYLKRMQIEVASGRAVRRLAESDKEKEILEKLHHFVFTTKKDEKLVLELAEESMTIGLSEAQWNLAARIVELGKSRDSYIIDDKENVREVDAEITQCDSETRKDGAEEPGKVSSQFASGPSTERKQREEYRPTRPEGPGSSPGLCVDSTNTSKKEKVSKMARVPKKRLPEVVEKVLSIVAKMADEERSILFEILIDDYCGDCGMKSPEHADDCSALEEDDEDDEDDDDEGEEDESEDEDETDEE